MGNEAHGGVGRAGVGTQRPLAWGRRVPNGVCFEDRFEAPP